MTTIQEFYRDALIQVGSKLVTTNPNREVHPQLVKDAAEIAELLTVKFKEYLQA